MDEGLFSHGFWVIYGNYTRARCDIGCAGEPEKHEWIRRSQRNRFKRVESSCSWIIDYESHIFRGTNRKNRSLRAHPFLNVRLFSLVRSQSEWFFVCCRKTLMVWLTISIQNFRSDWARRFEDDVSVCEFDWASKKILSFSNSILRNSRNSIF